MRASDYSDRIAYYDRQGNPISMEEWVEGLRPDNKRVASTTVNGVWVSTVWLGLDHGWGSGPPIIFETMAFARGLGFGELDSRRYATEEEALAGHEAVVLRARLHHHGWVKHARDRRRHQMKYYVKALKRRDELNEMEEMSLDFWLRHRR